MPKPIANNRNEQIINLRVFATLIVVLGHCIIIFDPSWSEPYGLQHQYACETAVTLKRFINLFQMELFFVISGICFSYGSKKNPKLIPSITKKAYRLLIPFIIIAFFWMLPIRLAVGFPRYEELSLTDIAFNIVTVKDAGHLWFLPVLFNIFVISFALQKCKANKFLILGISILLYLFHFKVAGFLLRQTLYYFMFFCLGSTIDLSAKVHGRKILIGIISTIPFVALTYLNINDGPLQAVKSICIILIFFSIIPSKTNRIIAQLDKDSFGIYLFHSPILLLGMTFLTFLPPPDLHFITVHHLGLHFSYNHMAGSAIESQPSNRRAQGSVFS